MTKTIPQPHEAYEHFQVLGNKLVGAFIVLLHVLFHMSSSAKPF